MKTWHRISLAVLIAIAFVAIATCCESMFIRFLAAESWFILVALLLAPLDKPNVPEADQEIDG